MYGLLMIIGFFIIYGCLDSIPDSIKEWWENSTLRKWIYPVLTISITIAVIVGIKKDILHWGVIAIPIIIGLPYIWGLILGIRYAMKNNAHRVTSEDETAARESDVKKLVARKIADQETGTKKMDTKEMDTKEMDTKEMDINDIDAKEIAVRCLIELGCQPKINEDNTVDVRYQGENFQLIFSPRFSRYLCIWDPLWATTNAADPYLPQIKEAINTANFSAGPTVVMTDPNEDGDIGLFSRYDMMLHPACPENVLYMESVLESFFETKEQVHRNFQQIKAR